MSICDKKMENPKMKGLLKGLRFISQIFVADNEKQPPEMEIGFPTDVKHVAHVGCDGPSVNSPSWMNDFKSSTDLSNSAPSTLTGPQVNEEAHVDSGARTVPDSPNRDLPELPKSSRRQKSAGTVVDSPSREKPDKPKPRRSSKSKDSPEQQSKPARQSTGSDSGNPSSPDIPKTSLRKKSKESLGGVVKSRTKAGASDVCPSQLSDTGSELGEPVSVPNKNESCHKSNEGGEERGFT